MWSFKIWTLQKPRMFSHLFPSRLIFLTFSLFVAPLLFCLFFCFIFLPSATSPPSVFHFLSSLPFFIFLTLIHSWLEAVSPKCDTLFGFQRRYGIWWPYIWEIPDHCVRINAERLAPLSVSHFFTSSLPPVSFLLCFSFIPTETPQSALRLRIINLTESSQVQIHVWTLGAKISLIWKQRINTAYRLEVKNCTDRRMLSFPFSLLKNYSLHLQMKTEYYLHSQPDVHGENIISCSCVTEGRR